MPKHINSSLAINGSRGHPELLHDVGHTLIRVESPSPVTAVRRSSNCCQTFFPMISAPTQRKLIRKRDLSRLNRGFCLGTPPALSSPVSLDSATTYADGQKYPSRNRHLRSRTDFGKSKSSTRPGRTRRNRQHRGQESCKINGKFQNKGEMK